MEENNTPEIGLKDVSEKLDTVLAAVADAQAKAAAAEAKAAKMADELEATKNLHPVNFAPKGKEKTEDKKDFRQFLTDVKAAKFGTVKAALQAGAVTGSYLVPTGFLPEVIDLLDRQDSLITKARRLPWGIDASVRYIPNLAGRTEWTTVAEGGVKPVSNPTFGQLKQELVKLAAVVVVTDELLADTAIDLSSVFAEQARAGLVEKLNNWLFNGNGTGHAGILGATGINTPTITGVDGLLSLKQAVPGFVASSGTFYIENALYNELASMARVNAPAWLYYEEGKMRIDGNDVVALPASVIGSRGAVFGDLGNVIFSPKNEFNVKYSDVATIVEGSGDSAVEHHLFQENKQAYRFEMRADITVVGSVWAKATVPAPAAKTE